MSKLTGQEPEHWHNKDGKHLMTDPRKIDGYKRYMGDADERGYWDHLDLHDLNASNPEPHPEDTAVITSLFEMVAAHQKFIENIMLLIAAIRERQGLDPTEGIDLGGVGHIKR